jgi:hypothetical protein
MANTFSCPATCSAGPTVVSVGAARVCKVVAQVVAHRTDAEALKPDVGGDLAAGTRGHRERAELASDRGWQTAESVTKDELDATIDKLLAQFGAQVGTEPVAEYVVGEVEERDVLVGPPCGDLAGELDSDGPGANEQNPVRTYQFVVCGLIVVDCVLGIVRVALGGERVRRSGSENDVVGRDRLARRQDNSMSGDVYRSVTGDTPVGEEVVIR